MKLISQIGIVLAIYLIGDILSKVLKLSIPGTILGMSILFLLLLSGILKLSKISDFSNFLLKNLSFFFIVPGVMIIDSLDMLKIYFIKLFIIIIVTTLVTAAVTGYTVTFFLKQGGKNWKKYYLQTISSGS